MLSVNEATFNLNATDANVRTDAIEVFMCVTSLGAHRLTLRILAMRSSAMSRRRTFVGDALDQVALGG
jgi:hypothetical protein